MKSFEKCPLALGISVCIICIVSLLFWKVVSNFDITNWEKKKKSVGADWGGRKELNCNI